MEYDKDYFYKMKIEFINVFNKNWNELMETLFFQQQQFSSGNRLRPIIVLIGYLSTKPNLTLDESDYEKISKLSLSIELIHKASLILDDFIDEDPSRHGKKAFHMEYGTENTIMFAINLLSVSANNLNSYIRATPNCSVLKEKGMNILIQTMYDMSLGELKELNLNDANRFERETVQEIINLETSPLIGNSLLLGYYAGNGNTKSVEKIFDSIGHDCGYIFQVMNDLEPFCQQEKLMQHKGRLNTDIVQSKKNIVLTLLNNLISAKEKEAINLSQTTNEINSLLINYFEVYNVKDTFMREVDFVHQNIMKQINSLKDYNLNENWCQLFSFFVNSIVKECKLRLV